MHYDFGDSPLIDGRKTVLFEAWLAWSRFRIVIVLRDRTAPTVFAALDRTLRIIGGAPTYVLTDNEKTVTVSHIAGVPVRNLQTVDFARHYGVTVLTCQPAVGTDAAEGLYRLVDAACEKQSIAVSSNLHSAGFDELLLKALATATVDRLLHHAHVCQTSGDSIRLTQALAGKGVTPMS